MKPSIPKALQYIHDQTWEKLQHAALQPEHALHYLSLSTVDANGHPQSRLLVLRAVDLTCLTLECYTDTRSAKWQELQHNSRFAILGYVPKERLQLRLGGYAELHPPDSAASQIAWNHLSSWARQSYCGGPPGAKLSEPATQTISSQPPTHRTSNVGQKVFGVLRFKVQSMDWFQHPRGQLQRARFYYGAQSCIQAANWAQE